MRTLTPALSILIAILLFVFFTKPLYSEIKSTQAEVDAYALAVEKYNEFSQALQTKLNKKTSRPEYEIERLDQLLPSMIDETQLLVDLNALALTHGLLFGNVSVEGNNPVMLEEALPVEGSQVASDELSTVDVSFDVIGTYEQFKTFLRDIESSLSLMEVTELNFTATEGSFQQFSVTVRAFALPS